MSNLATITQGDIHGFSKWEPIKDKIDQFDYIVFVGDYVDEFHLPNSQIYTNLVNILDFKKKYPDKVILLWGNHDVQYLFSHNKYQCSGYRPSMFLQLFQLFTHNRKHFQLAFQIENYLWTHAGVTHGWYNKRLKYNKYVKRNGRIDKNFLNLDPDDKNLATTLNRLFKLNSDDIHDVGYERGGNSPVGGPLWADKNELYKKPLPGYHQIVGHTAVKDIKHYNHYKGNDTSTTFIDCLENIENIENPFYELKIQTNGNKER